MYPVIILCGGLATRLRPLTETIPKSLIDVAGKPFLEYQLIALKEQGVEHVILSVGHLGNQIRDKIGDGGRFGLIIQYVSDGPTLLGTGGAVKRSAALLQSPFFVLYGDSYLRVNYKEVASRFLDAGTLGLMTVFRNEGKWDTSNVVFSGGKIVRYDKKNRSNDMEYIDYGLGLLKKEALESIRSESGYDLASLYQELVRQEQLAGMEVFERFYEIGTAQGLEETRAMLSKPSGGQMEDYSTTHLSEAAKIISLIDAARIESMVNLIAEVRNREGRIFFLGVGGGAANAAHAFGGHQCGAATNKRVQDDVTARSAVENGIRDQTNWLGRRVRVQQIAFIASSAEVISRWVFPDIATVATIAT